MEKRWVTGHFEGSSLAEFATESDLRRGRLAAEHLLPHDFRGTNSVFFNGIHMIILAFTVCLSEYCIKIKYLIFYNRSLRALILE